MKTNILIPDGHSTWALSVIKCLSEYSQYKIFVISNTKWTATRFSKHVSHFSHYERSDIDSWAQFINSEIEKHDIHIILPIAEEEIEVILKYKSLLSTHAKLRLLPSLETFQIAIDKKRLGKFCEEHQVPYPKSIFITGRTDLSNGESRLNFPVLLKPLHEKGGDGIVKFSTQKEMMDYMLNDDNSSEGYFIQEYIEGYDIDCSVICLNGKVLTHTIQKGFLPGHTPYAPQLGVEFLENQDVYHITENLMKALNWSGVAHIDLRYDANQNDYKVLEINARYWGSIQASNVAGVNFPHLSCMAALGKPIEPIPFAHIKYTRFKGVLKQMKRCPRLIFNNKFLFRNTETNSVLKDPFPTLYRFKEWLGRKMVRGTYSKSP